MESVISEVFKVVEVPLQKVFNDVPFPLVVSPVQPSYNNLAKAAKAHKAWVEAKLHEAGAVLFRGFTCLQPSTSTTLSRASNTRPSLSLGVAAPRTHIVGQIYTSNDNPPHNLVHFHNEIAYMEDHPSKGFLYCEVEPGGQGETPIVPGHIVYERLKKKHSGFMQRLEEHGLLYHKVLPDDIDLSSPIGKSWKSTFDTDDKSLAEHKAAKLGWKLEWLDNGVKLVMKPIPGIKIDKTRPKERKMWFNSLIVVLTSHVDLRYKLENPVTLGDGSPIPPEVVEECEVILDEECAAIPWKQGDVLMIDNCAVQHARRPFTPPRRVLVAFTK